MRNKPLQCAVNFRLVYRGHISSQGYIRHVYVNGNQCYVLYKLFSLYIYWKINKKIKIILNLMWESCNVLENFSWNLENIKVIWSCSGILAILHHGHMYSRSVYIEDFQLVCIIVVPNPGNLIKHKGCEI